MVSPGAAPGHRAGRLGKSGIWQNGCDGEEEQVQGLELPCRTAEQDFWRVEEVSGRYLAKLGKALAFLGGGSFVGAQLPCPSMPREKEQGWVLTRPRAPEGSLFAV